MVAGLRGAHDVAGVGQKSGAHRGEFRRGAVGELLRGQAFGGRSPLHLLAVLIHPGDEQDIEAVEPLEAGNRIGGDPLIGMSDMRRAIGVGYRGRDIERGAGTHELAILKFRAEPPDTGPCCVPFQSEETRAAAAKSAKRDRTNGLLSRLKVSVSRAASASFSHTRA